MKKYRIYLFGAAILIVGIIIGNTLSGSKSTDASKESEHKFVQDPKTKKWTCAMHPHLRLDKPGNCPICGMKLIPVEEAKKEEEKVGPDEVVFTKDALTLAQIMTTVVERSKAVKEIHLLGRVKPDERKLYTQVSHIPGRIESLYVNFTGEKVSKGQKIVSIYSPELVTAQKELFEAIKSKGIYPELYTASRNKLKLWKLTDKQIDEIEKSKIVKDRIDILSDHDGFVMKRNVELGDYVKEGSNLFDIANLTSVWVMFEAYESDIPWMHLNDIISFTIPAIPGKLFKGKVTYIDPFVSPITRVAKVRVELDNPGTVLIPEMFATGIIKAKLSNIKDAIIIPKSSVLWTGKRSVVYVKMKHKKITSFMMREVTLGQDMGAFYIIKEGLHEGEVIATNGVFRIDASAQLLGQKSMMNPEGGSPGGGMMNMPGMDMGGKKKKGSKRRKMSKKEMKNMKMDKKDMKNKVMIDKSKIDKKFKSQLGQAVHTYIQLKNALSKDNYSEAKKQSKALKSAFSKVKMGLLKGKSHNAWMADLKMLNKANNAIISAKNIKSQRDNFGPLGAALSKSIDKFGVVSKEKKIYVDYCPMVKQVWLSYDKTIQNPYFGKSMPTCGEVKKEIVSK
jgi:membrane fusion protein, copper/silver efflux system